MSRVTYEKRSKERARQTKQREKAVERAARKRERDARPTASGEDPDLVGIVAGPQPPRED